MPRDDFFFCYLASFAWHRTRIKTFNFMNLLFKDELKENKKKKLIHENNFDVA